MCFFSLQFIFFLNRNRFEIWFWLNHSSFTFFTSNNLILMECVFIRKKMNSLQDHLLSIWFVFFNQSKRKNIASTSIINGGLRKLLTEMVAKFKMRNYKSLGRKEALIAYRRFISPSTFLDRSRTKPESVLSHKDWRISSYC